MINLGLAGTIFQSVLIENSLVMTFSDVHFAVIQSPLTVESHGEKHLLSPEDDADEAFAPVRELIGQTVESAITEKAGTLRIVFSNGAIIAVPPDEDYEAWNVSGPNGALVVSMPGGELAIWSPAEGG